MLNTTLDERVLRNAQEEYCTTTSSRVVAVVDRTKTLQKKAFFAGFIMREKPFLFVWSIAFMQGAQ